MDTSLKAGPAAPAPAAVALPSYTSFDFVGNELSVRASADCIGDWTDVRICLSAMSGALSFCNWMTPALARQLAVYLVDCANAVDNPAQRVIVDEAEADAGVGIGHE